MKEILASNIGEILYNIKHSQKYVLKPSVFDKDGNLICSISEQEVIREQERFLTTLLKIISFSVRYDIDINKLVSMLKNEYNFIDTFESFLHIEILDKFIKQEKEIKNK